MKSLSLALFILALFFIPLGFFAHKDMKREREKISIITLYSSSGDILKIYKAIGFVHNLKSGILFTEINSGRRIELSGTYTVE